MDKKSNGMKTSRWGNSESIDWWMFATWQTLAQYINEWNKLVASCRRKDVNVGQSTWVFINGLLEHKTKQPTKNPLISCVAMQRNLLLQLLSRRNRPFSVTRAISRGMNLGSREFALMSVNIEWDKRKDFGGAPSKKRTAGIVAFRIPFEDLHELWGPFGGRCEVKY